MTLNRFRWVFCQLKILRNCLPQNVRRVLRELPASLDETYERMLRDILKANPDQTYRLLQCLAVATRPLGVDELAEILALDFDSAEDRVPILNKDWRWDDERQGVLATCSSLIVVVEGYVDFSKTLVVQFAHFSVKEFLTSHRLANLKKDISHFHIHLEPAHTVISQACLAVLLQSGCNDLANSSSPLTKYAAQHWVGHVQFGDVSLQLEDGIQRLFDPEKPYFVAWLNSSDLDHRWESFAQPHLFSPLTSLGKAVAPLCLYYAVLCGFRDLTKHFITMYPQHVNATVGHNKSPLAAALHNRHFQVAELLHQHGAVLPLGYERRTLLHAASADGLADVAQWLLKIGADANAQEKLHWTPLHFAAANQHLDLVRILLGHGVNVNAIASTDNHTPLHKASSRRHVGIVRLLVEHGADVHVQDQSLMTPLHLASSGGNPEIAGLLIEHGADVHSRDQSQSTPLHLAWNAETAKLLIEHGADVHARDENQSTPLHLASSSPSWTNAGTNVRLLVEHGASVNAYDENCRTPLHRVVSCYDPNVDSLRLLLENGADVDIEDDKGQTPFQIASLKEIQSRKHRQIAQLLLDHRACIISNTV
jgi:ankyrin repeat protein